MSGSSPLELPRRALSRYPAAECRFEPAPRLGQGEDGVADADRQARAHADEQGVAVDVNDSAFGPLDRAFVFGVGAAKVERGQKERLGAQDGGASTFDDEVGLGDVEVGDAAQLEHLVQVDRDGWVQPFDRDRRQDGLTVRRLPLLGTAPGGRELAVLELVGLVVPQQGGGQGERPYEQKACDTIARRATPLLRHDNHSHRRLRPGSSAEHPVIIFS
jgi:hypothetical protein